MSYKKIVVLFVLSFFCTMAAGYAQSPSGTSMKKSSGESDRALRDEILGFSPQFGVITVSDYNGDSTAQPLTGLGVDFNVTPLFSEATSLQDYYIGISTGAFYSHMSESMKNTNLLAIPANAKFGYNFTDSFRASIHGGANVIYRSAANSVNFGESADAGDSLWKVYPNVGADFEYQVGSHVSIIARPDLTFTPASNAFMATLGATFIPSL